MHYCVYKDTLIDSDKKCMFCRLCVERREIVFKKDALTYSIKKEGLTDYV